ncbi:MAG: HXXEE domain-containing protein [Pseudomonadota bacterium]
MNHPSRPLASVCLLALGVILWLPLGQQDFLAEHWMKVGAFIAPVLLFMACLSARPKANGWTPQQIISDHFLVAVLLAIAYLLHQVEEHWVDLLGRPYPLYETLNNLIASVFGQERYGVMTPTAIFYVNTGTVWTLAFLAILGAGLYTLPLNAMAGLVLVNGISHIGTAISSFSYNPGLGTSIEIFIPLSLGVLISLGKQQQRMVQVFITAILWGVAGHVFLFAGIIAANIYGIVPVGLYYAGLILFGVAPTIWARLMVSRAADHS